MGQSSAWDCKFLAFCSAGCKGIVYRPPETPVIPSDRSNDLGVEEGKVGKSSSMSADMHEKDDAGKIEVNQVDNDDTEEQAGLPAKVMHSPTVPSRQEVLEHNCTHIPFSQLVCPLRQR